MALCLENTSVLDQVLSIAFETWQRYDNYILSRNKTLEKVAWYIAFAVI